MDKDRNKLNENNSSPENVILNGIDESIYFKVLHYESTKEIWDKLLNIYEGYSKVKGAKIQTYKGQFEQIKMKEDEDIATYFLQVDEIVNSMKGLGEKIKEQAIVQKVLRSLPMIFDLNISALEEREDVAMLNMDELHGILIAYEMSKEKNNSPRKEATFKAFKKIKKNKHNPKSKPSCSCSDDMDE
jgi:hypothetical protein